MQASTGSSAGDSSGKSSGHDLVTSDPDTDHDTLPRRLPEPGEPHTGGVLTDEEFAAAEAALLCRLWPETDLVVGRSTPVEMRT